MKHYSQCLFYALTRWKEEGGELVFVKSTHWAIPHVQHRSHVTGTLTQFVPPEDLRATWHCLFGFYGEVVEGDIHPRKGMSLWGMFAGTVLLAVLGAVWAAKTKLREMAGWPRQWL